ncbi:MAG: (2Fe-2S)-binding protein [Deltaproteobacteria bacterium]|nr:(2Fe-2S)-binding protein [Deltaproteobacteria bacterium]
MATRIPMSFTINGDRYEMELPPQRTLLELLRDELGLTGTKESCGAGICGACTVLVDGQPVSSCIKMAFQVKGREITTIEGLAPGGQLDPLQEAFVRHGAIQCGYCTPGMIIIAKGLLLQNPYPSEEEIYEAVGSNICRCTGYVKIVEAVRAVARGER